MTRDELVKAIYASRDDWSCPDNGQCEKVEYGDPRIFCTECAEKLLKEYEDKIRADAVNEIIKKINGRLTANEICLKNVKTSGNFDSVLYYERLIMEDKIAIGFAKELIEPRESCFDCKHHFMSDCYLECYKHNRIDNDEICEDFEKEQSNG